MFESLTQRLSGTITRLRGRGRLTEENIREATREVRIALLEADVALPVVQALIERIKVRAVGQEVLKSLTPGQALIKVVRDELTAVMGAQASDLALNVPAPAVILMAGLQGAGKTGSVADYTAPATVDPQVITDLATWIKGQPARAEPASAAP